MIVCFPSTLRIMSQLVWLASYPKSGNTWTRLFIAAYLSGMEELDLSLVSHYSRSESLLTLFAEHAGKATESLTEEDIDEHRLAVQESLAASPGQFVVKTHNARLTRDFRRLVFSRCTRAWLYVVRNPLDVVDSLADHTNRSHDQAIALLNQPQHRLGATALHASQYVGTWSHHVRTWLNNRNEFPLLVLRFEDLKADPIGKFSELIRFLGWDYDRMRLERAVALTAFGSVRAAEDRQGFAETSAVAKSSRFFRHGESGRWRDILSEQQVATVIERHGETMRMLGYEV
jgi:hypothetical protein